MSDENKENIEQTNSESWWKKFLQAKKIIICFIIVLIILLCKFGYEQYQIYDFQKRYKNSPIGSIVETGKLNLPRSNHSCIRLRDGNILIVGGNKGAEIFNPKTGKYKLINKNLPEYNGSSMNSILLPNGNVLVAGYYIFDSNTYNFYPINNVEPYILQKILNYNSIPSIITPIILSNQKVLVIIEHPNHIKIDNRFLLYDIKNNSYEYFNLNSESNTKKYISGKILYVENKQKNIIHFISNTQTGIWSIKWNWKENKIVDVKNYSTNRWKQIYWLGKNIILNNINETSILDIDSGVIQHITKLEKDIYSTFNMNNNNYIFTSDNKNKNSSNTNIHISYIYRNNVIDYNIQPLKDYYKFSFNSLYNSQSIMKIDDGFLISGGQIAYPKNSRLKNSMIIKL